MNEHSTGPWKYPAPVVDQFAALKTVALLLALVLPVVAIVHTAVKANENLAHFNATYSEEKQ